jgi:hypothetical protein
MDEMDTTGLLRDGWQSMFQTVSVFFAQPVVSGICSRRRKSAAGCGLT